MTIKIKTIKIKPIAHLEVKGLILTFILTAFISETAQAQSIPTINIPTITAPNISVVKPSINIPKPNIPKPTVTIPNVTPSTPTVPVPKAAQITIPSVIEVNGTANNTRPSFVSAIKEDSSSNQISTGRGSTTINIPPANLPIPPATTTVSTINVVLPSTKIVPVADVNFNVTTTDIPSLGSLINTVNLSFPLPVLD
ncbi:hypothetical protein H6F47_16845 [Sphaerospermopsis sp. FACHB-1094]|uniref:hypothetical protein n=1 Tax=Sphaerospermopsis sp. FACHB-1094 TaxID=2692861 RepID=UPI0016869C28|nr:hypothetical protein [Sphaerospermopsis sp. FACHB-1094]MBD2134053.1 hypothetical protein [Sphaerospermopsis sp. FACHB-1094]